MITPLEINPLDPTYRMALTAVGAAEERKGSNILLLNVTQMSSLADYFLLVTGFSSTQVRAIARAIEEKMIEVWQVSPKRVEGLQMGSWVLMDFADIIIHIMMEEERGFYNLEAFWGEAHRVELPVSVSEALLNKPYPLQSKGLDTPPQVLKTANA
jgi:ribosome-associated protein